MTSLRAVLPQANCTFLEAVQAPSSRCCVCSGTPEHMFFMKAAEVLRLAAGSAGIQYPLLPVGTTP